MKLSEQISWWLGEYLEASKLDYLVVGISGGIDSALVSTLCAQTGYPTLLVSLPIHQHKDQLTRGYNHIGWLQSKYRNVRFVEIDLTKTFDDYKSLFDGEYKLANANSRSRLRMTTLYHLASINNGLVVGTGNKVEDFGVGFFTKYGDGGVDISPIGDLTKSEVRAMAQELGVDEDIVKARPTDGLWDDERTDEEQIGASYEELEWAMTFSGHVNGLTERQKQVLYIYTSFNTKNKHKMVPIPVFNR